MIVLDDEFESLVDPSIRKQPTTPPAASAYESSQPLRDHAVAVPEEPQPNEPLLAGQSSQPLGPPPAYPGYQSTGYQSFPGPPPPPPPADEYDDREPAGTRFIKAFIVAVLIYALAGSIVGSIVSSSQPAKHRHQSWRSESWNNIFPADSAVKVSTCAEQTEWSFTPNVAPGDLYPHKAVLESTFELTLGVLDLFVNAGPGIQGNVTFVDDDTLRDSARVHVEARLDDSGWSALMDTSVCKRTLSSMSNGVFIASTASDYLLQSLHFNVIVSMPTNPFPRALNIPELSVAMASMNLDMKLSAPYEFGNVLFHSNNGNMHVDTIVADDISLNTLNSAVTGSYTARRQFCLRTTNAPVDVTVSVSDKDNGRPTEVILGTTNAPLRGQVNLHTGSPHMTGNYRVVATTTNARLYLDYTHIPVNAKLDAFMRTTEAPIYAKLDSAFEGSFQLKSTNYGRVGVQNSTTHNADAGSARRHRDIAWNTADVRGQRVTQGVAHWSPSLRPVETMGSLLCSTTNQDIMLWA
ncbi:hypothetical protein PENSPDRAFT_754863 [Peniophora sp. CONT]|nr:hypothetical protein PENSPDRAFT_754863 [Peniophora sp. CONT]